MTIAIPKILMHIISDEDVVKLLAMTNNLKENYDTYKQKLELSADNITDELTHQAQFYSDVTQMISIASSINDTILYAVDGIKSMAEMLTRQAYEDDDISMLPFTINKINMPKLAKATEGVIKSAVESYDIVVEFNKISVSTRQVLQLFQGLERSWSQRSMNLCKLADFRLKEMNMPNSIYQKSVQSMDEQR